VRHRTDALGERDWMQAVRQIRALMRRAPTEFATEQRFGRSSS
jgi:hypothetical protein